MADIYEERDAKFEIAEMTVIEGRTELQKYYAGTTVLITGGSGFLGMLLIEKLLRSCPDIKKLILIVRKKKGKALKERAKELFNDVIYEKMKLSNPNYWKQVEIVNGDCEKPDYGMEMSEWRRLQQEVDVIFHAAATIRFDEHIKISYNTNVAGTKVLLEMAKGMPHLKAVVYVSTAYSQSHLKHIGEKFYATPFTDEQMIELLKQLDDVQVGCLTPFILDGRYNTYTMTKAMAEHVISKYVDELPVAIFRPPIVTATFDSPLLCWTNSIAGATGVFVGAGVGFLRTLYCDPNGKAEIIAADRVINCLAAVPLHIQKRREKMKTGEFTPIYNYIANPNNVLTWNDVMIKLDQLSAKRRLKADTVMWAYHLSLDKNYYVWLIKYYLLHLLPLPFFILLEKLSGLKPRVVKAYIKLYNYTKLLSFFMVQSWTHDWSNVQDLMSTLSYEDKILFNCDNNIDWNLYLFNMGRGLGSCILKVDWNAPVKHKFRHYMIRILDKIIVYGLKFLFIWYAYDMLSHAIKRLCLEFGGNKETVRPVGLTHV